MGPKKEINKVVCKPECNKHKCYLVAQTIKYTNKQGTVKENQLKINLQGFHFLELS